MIPFDAHGEFAHFSSENGLGDLKRKAVRGAGVIMLTGASSLVIQLVSTVLLARLISPRDFGAVAIVFTFSLLLSNCGVNGITEAVVQPDRMSHRRATALFWVTVGTGVVLTAGFAASGGLLARFYREPLVQPIVIGLSPMILFQCSAVLHLALLKRAMRFSRTALIDLFSNLSMIAVSILLGFAGWGCWALVTGFVTYRFVNLIGALLSCRWMPGRPRLEDGLREPLGFALNTYSRFSLNYFGRNADNMLVGWRFGAGALGYYKRAYDLFALPAGQIVSAVTTVAVAALSRLVKDPQVYRRHLCSALSMVAFLGFGLSGLLTLAGHDLIRLLLGPRWGPSGDIFTLFAPGIGILALYNTHGWIHLSIGRADRWLRWGIVEWTVTILMFLAMLHWGPKGIAIAWVVSLLVLTVPACWYAGRPIGLGAGFMVQATWRYLLASTLAGLAGYTLLSRFGLSSAGGGTAAAAAVRIALDTIVFTTLYLIGVVAVYGGPEPLLRVRSVMGILSAKKRDDHAEEVATA